MPEKPDDDVTFDLGGCRVSLLDGGRLRLDGGAMFGIIPKPLWSRATAADALNRIPLACNCLLVEFEGSDRRFIVETGHGAKYAQKEREIFEIDPSSWLRTSLAARGVDPGSISDVVLTHLHFDHAGGLTWLPDGASAPADARPTFPAARVHVQRRELDDARANFGIMTATYRPENFAPIDRAEAWSLIDGEAEIAPGLHALPTPGHTRGHQSILLRGRERTAVFVGDVMPTAAHVGAPYNMAYDLFPIENRASKRELLSRAAAEDWLLLLDHEPRTPAVRVVTDKAWFRLEPDGAPR